MVFKVISVQNVQECDARPNGWPGGQLGPIFFVQPAAKSFLSKASGLFRCYAP